MKRSNAQKRLDINDAVTKDVRERMLSMENWRDEFELRFAEFKQENKKY